MLLIPARTNYPLFGPFPPRLLRIAKPYNNTYTGAFPETNIRIFARRKLFPENSEKRPSPLYQSAFRTYNILFRYCVESCLLVYLHQYRNGKRKLSVFRFYGYNISLPGKIRALHTKAVCDDAHFDKVWIDSRHYVFFFGTRKNMDVFFSLCLSVFACFSLIFFMRVPRV